MEARSSPSLSLGGRESERIKVERVTIAPYVCYLMMCNSRNLRSFFPLSLSFVPRSCFCLNPFTRLIHAFHAPTLPCPLALLLPSRLHFIFGSFPHSIPPRRSHFNFQISRPKILQGTSLSLSFRRKTRRLKEADSINKNATKLRSWFISLQVRFKMHVVISRLSNLSIQICFKDYIGW